jgi:hypothetical protein
MTIKGTEATNPNASVYPLINNVYFSNLSPIMAPARHAGSEPKINTSVWLIENKPSYF